jgi:hypothetical protein
MKFKCKWEWHFCFNSAGMIKKKKKKKNQAPERRVENIRGIFFLIITAGIFSFSNKAEWQVFQG